ncbi:hypothetical protein GOODEAATRI_013803 [Goodea atripinnis]|uniref:Uncharacterized protein n=1 Tax=Goodea atripinnis TaxID=208336 RepID=A0ABV0PNC8_9TELE
MHLSLPEPITGTVYSMFCPPNSLLNSVEQTTHQHICIRDHISHFLKNNTGFPSLKQFNSKLSCQPLKPSITKRSSTLRCVSKIHTGNIQSQGDTSVKTLHG